MKISIIGSGYVGLVTGTCLAETGNTIYCVDIDEEKISKLSNGQLTIYEPDLDILFKRNTKQGNLHFTMDLAEAVSKSDIIFLALPTPSGEDGSADLQYILQVAEDLSQLINHYTVIVDKSTVPVGTAELVAEKLEENISRELFDVVSNPEFLREGKAVDDFMKPDRVVIGTDSDKAAAIMRKLYEPFVRQGNPIYIMDVRSAELTKYASNSYLATRITFMNEIANICEKVGADVTKVRIGMGSDSRIGKRFLFPGIGYGGSCFPKDVKALSKISEENEYEFQIIQSVMSVNEEQKLRLYYKMKDHFSDLSGKKIAVWGLSFKPDTDDIREAPSLVNIERFLNDGAEVSVYDPEAMDNVKEVLGDRITYNSNLYDALESADALVIMTEWRIFRSPDFDKMKDQLNQPVIFDGRNLYSPSDMEEIGFKYYSIGRKAIA